MSQVKKRIFTSIYIILFLALIVLNATYIVDWLNKSMFVDFDMKIEKVHESFYKGTSLVILLLILMYSIFGTLIVSLILSNILFGTFIFANNVKVYERNEFITFSELKTITSPQELISFIDISLSEILLLVISIIVILFILHYAIIKVSDKVDFKINKKFRLLLFIITTTLLITIYMQPNLYNKYFLDYKESSRHNFNPLKRAQIKGFFTKLYSYC